MAYRTPDVFNAAMQLEASLGFSIVAFGQPAPCVSNALAIPGWNRELISHPVPPSTAAEWNALLDSASHAWILILHGGETIDDRLGREIASAIPEPSRAWAFRMRSAALYGSQAIHLGGRRGEIRLLHRRHVRFDIRRPGAAIKVQGPVILLRNPIIVEEFPGPDEHARFLARTAVPHSFPRRVALFTRRAFRSGGWRKGFRTLQYLWIEAGYDRNPAGRGIETGAR